MTTVGVTHTLIYSALTSANSSSLYAQSAETFGSHRSMPPLVTNLWKQDAGPGTETRPIVLFVYMFLRDLATHMSPLLLSLRSM